MQYLLLIYETERSWDTMPETESRTLFAECMRLDRAIIASGAKVAGEALQPVHTAITVRVRDGRTLTTDGPFAETREQLGGFYLITAQDLDEATAIAARIPSARTGSIEVRPIQVFA